MSEAGRGMPLARAVSGSLSRRLVLWRARALSHRSRTPSRCCPTRARPLPLAHALAAHLLWLRTVCDMDHARLPGGQSDFGSSASSAATTRCSFTSGLKLVSGVCGARVSQGEACARRCERARTGKRAWGEEGAAPPRAEGP